MRIKVFLLLLLTLSLMFIADLFINVNVEEVRSLYESTLVVYTAMDRPLANDYIKKFEDENNIKVLLIRESTEILYQRLLDEADNAQADVIWGVSLSSVMKLDHRGMLKPYNGTEAESDIVELQEEFNVYYPNLVGIREWSPAICVNTSLLSSFNLKEPRNWQDLIQPIYGGRIVMPSPTTSGTGFLIVSSILQQTEAAGDNEKSIATEKNWKQLEDLNKNVAVYTESGSEPCTKVENGEYPIGISSGYIAFQQSEKSDTVKSYYLEDDIAWELDVVALVNKEMDNPAAQVFFEWAVSQEVRDLYQNSTFTSDNKMDGRIFPWMIAHQTSILETWKEKKEFMNKIETDN